MVENTGASMAEQTAILVVSDLTPETEPALQRAVSMAEEQKASLEILHILEEEYPSDVLLKRFSQTKKGLHQKVLEGAKEKIGEVVKGLAINHSVPIGVHVEAGKDFVVTIQHARTIGASLIVVNWVGDSRFRRMFAKVRAEKIVRKADRPVLVVKSRPSGPYRRVLAGIDFSDASRQALKVALQFAPEADFRILHACEPWGEGRLSLAGGGTEILEQYQRQNKMMARGQLSEFLREFDCRRDRRFRPSRQKDSRGGPGLGGRPGGAGDRGAVGASLHSPRERDGVRAARSGVRRPDGEAQALPFRIALTRMRGPTCLRNL